MEKEESAELLANNSVPHNANGPIVDVSKIKFVDDTKDEVRVGKLGTADAKEAHKMLGAMSDVDPAQSRIATRVYARRWIVLAAVALLNNSNTMLWIAFAAVANHANVFYAHSQAANWFSLVYIVCTIPVGVFAMWMGSRFGIRTALFIASWANAVGASIRLSSSFLPMEWRFPVGICGQAIAACAYPFIMFLPTKVAGTWFAENERTLATTIGIMSNPLGVLVANLLSPQIVTKPDDVPIVNSVMMGPALIACLLVTFGVTRGAPLKPPSLSAAQTQTPFVEGLKKCVSSRSYLIMLLVMGGGIGMFNCLYTIIQQLLCPSGYSNAFSGLCAVLMIIGGVFGSAASSIFVDRTKFYEETMKTSMSLAVVAGILFLQLTLHPYLEWALSITCICFGAFGLAAYPVGLQMSAECTFPVSETTSTGLIVLSGQVQSIIYVAMMGMASRPLQPDYMHLQTCTSGAEHQQTVAKDNTYATMMFSAVAATLALILVIAFKPKLKRLLAEHGVPSPAKDATAPKSADGRQLDAVHLAHSDRAVDASEHLTLTSDLA